ncbi:MAG: chemotaxis protein CheX [Spirochaetota bacterium]
MDVKDALDEAVITSFADMAFMDAVVEPDDVPEADSVSVGQLVHIRFGHPSSGFLTLYLGLTTKQRLVENVYGRGWDELSDSEVDDCLMELANIVAGNFMLERGEEEDRHAVSLPQVLYDEADLPPAERSLSRHYRVDDELIRVVVAHE